MKKILLTKKQVNGLYSHVVRVDYCEAQNLLKGFDPVAYTAGVYGWRADVYDVTQYAPEGVGSVAIVTGYQPFGDLHPFSSTVKFYDDAAKEGRTEALYNGTYNDLIKSILNSFIWDCVNNVFSTEPRSKEDARDRAIEWQLNFDAYNSNWTDIAEAGAFFEEYGRKFGLLREFRENGIL